MLFNSIAFAAFLPIVFALYWFVTQRNLRLQNLLVIAASYVFYGWWDWRFLSLIFVSSLTDYLVGLGLGRTERLSSRKLLLATSLAVNIGLLGFFKYAGFFVDSLVDALRIVGIHANISSLRLILPVGISFYTFQTLSYTIDVYRREISPTRDAASFFAFVSFFPQLVAGPIERARNLLPQFESNRTFDCARASDGLKQMIWGLFKKVAIADRCAPLVDEIFGAPSYADLGGSTLVVGAVLFAVQIYCDFSGYSDMAIGIARLFGFNLKRNFAYPYFSRNIAEFWRRWHISLSTWFRDYVYIPLGGSRRSTGMHVRNVMITFVLSALWHGANWTFVAWGCVHGFFYTCLMLMGRHKEKNANVSAERSVAAPLRALPGILVTFALTTSAWVFFRADTIPGALEYFYHIVSFSTFSLPPVRAALPLLLAALLITLEWFQRDKPHPLQLARWPLLARWSAYYTVLLMTLALYGENKPFIYFQF